MANIPKKPQCCLKDEQIKPIKWKNTSYWLYIALLLNFYEYHQRFFELPTELKYYTIKIREHFNSSGVGR